MSTACSPGHMPAGLCAHMEGIWSEELVEPGVEAGVLEAVARDQQEDAVEGQHARQASLVQRGSQEVWAGGEKHRVVGAGGAGGVKRHDAGVLLSCQGRGSGLALHSWREGSTPPAMHPPSQRPPQRTHPKAPPARPPGPRRPCPTCQQQGVDEGGDDEVVHPGQHLFKDILREIHAQQGQPGVAAAAVENGPGDMGLVVSEGVRSAS